MQLPPQVQLRPTFWCGVPLGHRRFANKWFPMLRDRAHSLQTHPPLPAVGPKNSVLEYRCSMLCRRGIGEIFPRPPFKPSGTTRTAVCMVMTSSSENIDGVLPCGCCKYLGPERCRWRVETKTRIRGARNGRIDATHASVSISEASVVAAFGSTNGLTDGI